MTNYKTSISKLALVAVLSTTLMASGCNKKNKSEPVNATVKARTVNDANAMQALTLMGLNESGIAELKWNDRSGDKGNYVFTTVSSTDEDEEEANLGTLELKGVRMEGEQAIFDQLVLNDFKAVDEDDGTVVTFKTFSLTEPSPALASAFSQAFNGDEDAFDDIEGDVSFTAISFTGLNVTNEDGIINMDSLNLGKAKDGTGGFSLNDLNMDIKEDGTQVKMNLGSMDVTGFNIDKYKGIFMAGFEDGKKGGDGISEEALKNLMGAMDPYDPDFKDFSFKNFHVDADGLTVNLDSMDGKAVKKGDKITMTFSMSPLTITPSKTSEDRDMKKFTEALDTLGYESLEFTMAQTNIIDAKTDSVTVKDTYIAMKDGFKLSFDYDMAGYKAYMEEALKLSGKADNNPMAMLGMLDKLQVSKLRIGLKDDSIVDRSFKLAASQQGGTAESLKLQAKAGLAFLPMMAKNEGQQQIASQLSTALGEWLEKSGTLVINMAPEEPIVIGDIAKGTMSGDLDVSTLGLTITQE